MVMVVMVVVRMMMMGLDKITDGDENVDDGDDDISLRCVHIVVDDPAVNLRD